MKVEAYLKMFEGVEDYDIDNPGFFVFNKDGKKIIYLTDEEGNIK